MLKYTFHTVALLALLPLVACGSSHKPAKDSGTDGGDAGGDAGGDGGEPRTHAQNCDKACTQIANCRNTCDLDEDPDCTEEELFQQIYTACSGECLGGVDLRPEACAAGAADYAECLKEDDCTERCFHFERIYLEQCVFQPGFLACQNLCDELRAGCIPYEHIGLRGPDCKTACMAASEDMACLSSIYTYDECSADVAYGCVPTTEACLPKLDAIATTCDGIDPVSVDGEESDFCDALAEEQCRCGIFFDVDQCELRARRRCLFGMGHDENCPAAGLAFHTCIKAIDDCDRPTVMDLCATEWDAYSAACD